jgi:DNA repair protein RecO (recombination protein O)
MGTLGQAEVLKTYRSLRESLELAAYAAYFCELAAAAAEDRPHGSVALYQQFSGTLHRLRAGQDIPQIVARVWETKVLRMVGASPNWQLCVRCGEPLSEVADYRSKAGGFLCAQCVVQADSNGRTPDFSLLVPTALAQVLTRFAETPWERLGEIRLKSENLNRLDQILRIQLTDYAGIVLRSRRFLDQLDELSKGVNTSAGEIDQRHDEAGSHQV